MTARVHQPLAGVDLSEVEGGNDFFDASWRLNSAANFRQSPEVFRIVTAITGPDKRKTYIRRICTYSTSS
jgi:hypothetical protein